MKENKGITLLALVITIIVLLILAGISIAMLSGDNSIINQATNAKEQTKQKEDEEQDILDEYVNVLNAIRSGTVTPSQPSSGSGGLQPDGSFIGLKSIGKDIEGEIDNTQTTNPTADGTGYRFQAGHFVHITNYDGSLWDETTGRFEVVENADVYLCWDGDYGPISSEQDLIHYVYNNEVSVYWDIFDSSGGWLHDDLKTFHLE